MNYWGNSMLLSGLLGIGVFLIVLLIAIVVLVYVFESLALYTIAQRRKIPYYGLAWVPVANYWIIGKIADGYNEKAKVPTSLRFAPLLLGLGIGVFVGMFIPFINILAWCANIVLLVFYFMALYKIYLSCMPNNAVVFTVLSIIFSITTPFFLFACRNHDAPIMKEDGDDPQDQAPQNAIPAEAEQESTNEPPVDEAPETVPETETAGQDTASDEPTAEKEVPSEPENKEDSSSES